LRLSELLVRQIDAPFHIVDERQASMERYLLLPCQLPILKRRLHQRFRDGFCCLVLLALTEA
jgi:hypothetical protein